MQSLNINELTTLNLNNTYVTNRYDKFKSKYAESAREWDEKCTAFEVYHVSKIETSIHEALVHIGMKHEAFEIAISKFFKCEDLLGLAEEFEMLLVHSEKAIDPSDYKDKALEYSTHLDLWLNGKIECLGKELEITLVEIFAFQRTFNKILGRDITNLIRKTEKIYIKLLKRIQLFYEA